MLGIHGLSDVKKRTDGRNWSHVHKFGSNGALSGSDESIWSAGGLYPWSALSSPQTLYVSSTVGDGDDGSVEIQGLDSNWNILTETVSLAGSPSEVTTTNTFRRVFRMLYSSTNTGVITARTVSHAGTIVAQIDIGKAQTLMSVYTIPAGHIGYLLNYTAGVGKLDNADLSLYVRDGASGAFRIKSEMSIYESIQRQEFSVPLRFSEKTDIDFRAKGATGNSKCTLNFDLVINQRNR
jgi:hypothetical protein